MTAAAPAHQQSRSLRGLVALLTAEGIALAGTRLSMIALPWYVLTTTGSPALTGLVAFAETLPYVVAKALGGPVIDKVGPRRAAVVADTASMAVVGTVPMLYALDLLHFGVLIPLVVLLGICRGPGDTAKKAMIPEVVEQARVPIERATGVSGTLERLAATVGAFAAGAIVALLGPMAALALNSATFAVAAAIVRLAVPAGAPASTDDGDETYVARLRAGFAYLVRDRMLRSLAAVVAVTNLLEAAMVSVLLPTWAHSSGHGPQVFGFLAGVSAGFAIGAALLAAAIAHRLPRRATFLIAFLVAGPPRFFVLALDVPLPVTVIVWAIGGFGGGFLNPIIWAVFFERTPRELLGRVQSLFTSMAWAGIPIGSVVGGILVTAAGLSPVLLGFGLAYLAAMGVAGRQREWTQMNLRRGAQR